MTQARSQDTLLLNVYSAMHQSYEIEGYSVGVVFMKLGGVCDPLTGLMPYEEQMKKFKNGLLQLGIDTSRFLYPPLVDKYNPLSDFSEYDYDDDYSSFHMSGIFRIAYKVYGLQFDQIRSVQVLAASLGIKSGTPQIIYKPITDQLSLNLLSKALQKANHLASIVADGLNMQVESIRSVNEDLYYNNSFDSNAKQVVEVTFILTSK